MEYEQGSRMMADEHEDQVLEVALAQEQLADGAPYEPPVGLDGVPIGSAILATDAAGVVADPEPSMDEYVAEVNAHQYEYGG